MATTTVAPPAPAARYRYENYDKPIVLMGLSSSPRNDELRRLAISLSGSLVGNDPARLRSAMDALGRSQGAGMLGDDDDDDDDRAVGGGGAGDECGEVVAGIALSALGLDDEGPFVLDPGLIGELVRGGIMSLSTGVVVLDFNHPAFSSSSNDRELEVDLIRALGSVAKRLYEEEGLMCVYVNVDPDDPVDDPDDDDDDGMTMAMGREARERKRMIEKEILVSFSDYELCIRNEGGRIHSSSADGGGEDQKEGGDDEEEDGKKSSPASVSSSSSWADVEWELRRIIARALLPPPVVGETGTPNSADLVMGVNTFFLSLSFPRIEDASPYVERLCEDVDSMEYRVDLLEAAKEYRSKSSPRGGEEEEEEDGSSSSRDPRFDILYQQQRLRALCRPHARRAPALPFAGSGIIDDALPIVYTVRTAHQAGTWPDDDDGIGEMFDLLDLGLRSAAEVLDVESAWDDRLTSGLLTRARERYTSLILGSHHVVGTEVAMEEAVRLFRQCRMDNRAHAAKVVLSINSNENDEDQLAYRASIASSKMDEPEIPNIGLVLGEVGSYSRIVNPRFTPVTHDCLPAKAAPGQLTAAEIMAGRYITGMIPAQRYAILGHNIAYSVSPQMQGGAFAAVKLPHTYSRADVETVEEFVEGPIWNDENFGGCSVTVPHKQSIIPHVDVLTDAAKEIGSVNTVIVKKDKFGKRVLIGDNTDWRGIYDPLKRRIGDVKEGGGTGKMTRYALILGGGGTARAAAFAATKLGLERIYFNRTPQKAMDLAAEFGGLVTSSLDDDPDGRDSLGALLSENNGKVEVVISTLPAAVGFQLPEWMLSGRSPLPVVFDVNYKPYDTALLLQATGSGCDVVRGSEMLWTQGAGQFELWTGRTAPYGMMKRVVLDNCLPSGGEEKKE
jgi:pentafunctional AROM polypeptide